MQKLVHDELDRLLEVLPHQITRTLQQREDLEELLEVVLDLGRVPEARFTSGDVVLDDLEVQQEDLDYLVEHIGDFGDDNRAGIERTLHRISAIRNRKGQVVGITCRVGRAVYGTIKIIEDLAFSGQNILLLGRPGVGKTTMLREMARVLADEAKKRVIIVDTSNEIAGDGDIPHPAIGHARRMQVVTPARQHAVMIEAVENHMPEVIIIDEMGTEQEAAAARTIAERGVQLIATAHGNTLDNLILNPTLSDLIGGVQTVTLGDQEAKFRGTQKTVLERKAPPTFDVVVEIQNWNQVAVHEDVAQVVDQALRGYEVAPVVRYLDGMGEVKQVQEAPRRSEGTPAPWSPDLSTPGGRRFGGEVRPAGPSTTNGSERHIDERVFLFGVGRDKLEAAQLDTGIRVDIVNELKRATLVLTTKTHYRRGAQLVRIAESSGTPVYVLRKNTLPQLMDFLRTLAKDRGMDFGRPRQAPMDRAEDSKATLEEAMQEAEEAAQRVLGGEFSIQLRPQRPYVRRLQHILAQRFSLASTSKGREPERGVLIYKP
ncbi:MAG TPA: R3H domain-containing nucleic acid-binding protein [Dehalococcoidia bacterium]|nr:R3H domain-containing nucleic acid-binding protein [Dehalococcoidia bacterium]